MSSLKSTSLTIENCWLQSGYYVYAVRIIYKNKTYIYIGQTGDNHYHSARAPLYRISGHFTKGVSTENQIVKYFKTKILDNKEVGNMDLEEAMCQSVIKYTFWQVATFDYGNSSTHEKSRNISQLIEQWLIFHLQDFKNITLLNGKVKSEITASKKKYFMNKTDNYCEDAKQILMELGYE